MAQFSTLAMLIAAGIIIVLLVIIRFISSLLNASLGVTSYKKGASKVPIIGGSLEFIFGSVFRIIIAIIIVWIVVSYIIGLMNYIDSNTIQTPQGTMKCWPIGMLKCESFEVNEDVITVILKITEDIPSIEILEDSLAETPLVYLSKSNFLGKSSTKTTILCPMKNWEYENNELRIELTCGEPYNSKSIEEQLKENNANTIGINWKLGITEPPQVALKEQVVDILSIVSGNIQTFAKYYEGSCKTIEGNEMCEVNIGAELKFN